MADFFNKIGSKLPNALQHFAKILSNLNWNFRPNPAIQRATIG